MGSSVSTVNAHHKVTYGNLAFSGSGLTCSLNHKDKNVLRLPAMHTLPMSNPRNFGNFSTGIGGGRQSAPFMPPTKSPMEILLFQDRALPGPSIIEIKMFCGYQ